MMALSHIAAGCAAALLTADWIDASADQTVLILAGGVLGSLLPDIDHPKSSFGRRVLPISIPISVIFGHRGITHSVVAVVGMVMLVWYAMNRIAWDPGFSVPFVAGIATGYLSHLLGDWMTNSGVPLLWPSRRRFVSPVRLFTGDALEYLLAFVGYGWVMLQIVTVFGR